MKAVRFLGGGQLRVVELPTPTPGPGQVLVKILASAVCGSERGDYLGEINPGRVHISGHEAVGDVVDPNGSKRFRENDRVCVQIMNGCGVCPYCKKGLPTFCESLRYENGCHAQYVAMPETCFVPIDADIPPQTAVLLGGDLLGVAWRAIRQLSLEKDELVFVSGCGPIGLGVSFVLKALGAKVIIAEPHPSWLVLMNWGNNGCFYEKGVNK